MNVFNNIGCAPSPPPSPPNTLPLPCSIRTVVEASAASPSLPSSSLLSPQPSPPSLSAAISAATKEIVGLCDAHQSLRASRSLSFPGEGGGLSGAGAGVEEMDRLAATASSLREAVGVLRRHGTDSGGDGGKGAAAAGDAAAVAAAGRAMSAVKGLAGLLASEVRTLQCCLPAVARLFFSFSFFFYCLKPSEDSRLQRPTHMSTTREVGAGETFAASCTAGLLLLTVLVLLLLTCCF